MIDPVFAAEVTNTAAAAHEAVGPLGTFGLNGKLFLAQLINFIIVLIVLAKWVYKPLLRVMDERTNRIEQSLKDATLIEEAKKAMEVERDAAILAARRDATAVLTEAKEKSAAMIATATARAQEEVAGIVTQARQQIVGERALMREEVEKEVVQLAARIAEKFLGEKMTSKEDLQLLQQGMKEVKTK